MELKEQVCTLEQAKKLKEMGIEQVSLFYYLIDLPSHKNDFYEIVYCKTPRIESGTYISAFLLSEIGVMLNSETYTTRTGSEGSEYANWEWVDECNVKGMGVFKTEAEARCDMLIFNLLTCSITISDCNKRILS